jgi:ABC-type uncharacterized transport system ATPase component
MGKLAESSLGARFLGTNPGANGSGKSSLFDLISGDDVPCAGHVI